MNKTSLDFPSGTVIADAGIARKGSGPSYSAGPSSATAIDGRAELVAGDEAGEIRRAYREALREMAHGLRRVIICGGLLNEAKMRIGYGRFMGWLEKNLPEIPGRTARRWMDLATGLEERMQNGHNGQFDGMPINRLLELPEVEISEGQAAARAAVMELLEGKTQVQLTMDFQDFSPQRLGGDNEYLAFLREKHPDQLKEDGKIPKRKQEFMKEFQAWQLKRMNPKARAEHVLMICNRAADYAASGMRLALMEDSLFKCSKDRLIILWDLNQKLNKILLDARGGKTGTDGTDGT